MNPAFIPSYAILPSLAFMAYPPPSFQKEEQLWGFLRVDPDTSFIAEKGLFFFFTISHLWVHFQRAGYFVIYSKK